MIIDLRSDTVTKPTKGMLEAMFSAEVGDDVFGEEPTVSALEEKAAKLFGKEAGLYCPSGTMTNQIAIKVHTQPGDEVLCDTTAHIYNYEGGGIAFNSGVQAKLIQGDRGRIAPEQIIENINPDYDWLTRTQLVCIENTGNKAGGSYYTVEQMQSLAEVCKNNSLRYHLDGARIFNAITELVENGSDLSNGEIKSRINAKALEIGSCFDSISVCLSKGLGAPVGSVLLGTNDFIKKARKVRKVFGGGMRQAGYIAAAGIYALDNHIVRLKEDHKRAGHLAGIIKGLGYVDNLLPVETNIVIFNLDKKIKPESFIRTLAENNIKASGFGKQAVRFVTHLDFTDQMLDEVEKVLKKY
ncbi:MAG: GntG family PLP-dependent aldolase [Bacteroidia bacterium]|jgi:threonine aldolase